MLNNRWIVVATAALWLGGCAQLSAVGTGISLATKSIANPVTIQELYEIEASINIVITALDTYKKACIAHAVDTNCRANIASIQPYTHQIPVLLFQLRGFVKQHDQISATVVYNELLALYGNIKTAADAVGISVGG